MVVAIVLHPPNDVSRASPVKCGSRVTGASSNSSKPYRTISRAKCAADLLLIKYLLALAG